MGWPQNSIVIPADLEENHMTQIQQGLVHAVIWYRQQILPNSSPLLPAADTLLLCYDATVPHQCFVPKEATLVRVVVFRDPQVCVVPHPLRLLASMFMYLDV